MSKSAGRFIGVVIVFITSLAFAQTLNPGVDRWAIKTSLLPHSQRKNVSLRSLLALSNPIESKSKEYNAERIPTLVEGDLKEGDLVTTTGWLELVALEDDAKKHRDGDYHIQLRNYSAWADSCLIVEIPFPDFIEDTKLKESCAKARAFVKERLLGGNEPSKKGTPLIHPAYVRITGQLFFDAAHLHGGLRGKTPKGYPLMHSYTCWEIHPVVVIAFSPLPK